MNKVKHHPKVDRRKVRASRARIYYIRPDPAKPHRVKLYLSPDMRHMHATASFVESHPFDSGFAGMVRSYHSRSNGRDVVRPRHIIATMYLNVKSLRENPGEIISHECTHAGMTWARLRKADLSKMPGEEILCYATGRMVRQVNRIGYMAGIW